MNPFLSDRRQLMAMLGASTGAGLVASSASPSAAQPTAGAVASPMRSIEEFGARGDGEADDSAAFERALAGARAGEVLALTGGRSYRLTRSLVLTRPIVIVGGTRENTRLLFDDGAYARLGGMAAAIILPHERSRGPMAGATGRRSSLSGFSVVWIGQSSTVIHGILIAAPAYLSEIDVLSFPADGFRVEAQSGTIEGNANGCSFTNCSALRNGGNGFAFYGNDANACLLLGSRAFDNRRAGFYDGSLLGNTYVAGEVDGNLGAGFASTKTMPNRSVYIGCYAEPNQRYDLNPRNLVVGALGHIAGLEGTAAMRALPSGELGLATHHVFAATENAASLVPDSSAAFLRIGHEGLELGCDDGQRVRLTKLLSENYVDLINGEHPLIRFPAGDVTGNITAQRPWLPQGFIVGDKGRSGILGVGAAPPTQGTFEQGAMWLNEAPRPGEFVGWVCTRSGKPGQWQAFGRIEGGD